GDDSTVRIWDITPRPGPALVFPGQQGNSISLEFSPDGRRLLTAGSNETIHVSDTSTGKVIRRIGKEKQLGAIHLARFNPDGNRLLIAYERNWQVIDLSKLEIALLVDAATGKELVAFRDTQHLRGGSRFAAISPDGRHVVVASDDLSVCVWNAADGKLLKVLKQFDSPTDFIAFS